MQGLNHWTTREVPLCGVCTWPPCLTQFSWFSWWFSRAFFNIAISVVCCVAPFYQLLAPGLAGTPGHRGSLGTEAGFCFLPGCFFFWPCCSILDLSSHPGIDPGPPAVEVRSPNHWTAWDVPPGLSSIKSDIFAIDFCETPFVNEEVSSLVKLCVRKAKAFKIITGFPPFNLLVW